MKPSRDKVLDDLKHQLILGKRVLAIGIVLLCAAVFFFVKEWKEYRALNRAPGKVIEMDKVQNRKDSTDYPVIEFQDSSGVKHVFHTRDGQLRTWSGWSGYYNVGDSVGVLYPAANPEDPRLDNLPTVWSKTMSSGGVGFILVVIGILLWTGAKQCPVDQLTSQDDPYYEEA